MTHSNSSFPTEQKEKQPQQWADELHDLKNEINHAVMALETLLEDPEKITNNAALMHLLQLRDTLQTFHTRSVADITQYKTRSLETGPHDAEKVKMRGHYLDLLQPALRQAQQSLSLLDEKTEESTSIRQEINSIIIPAIVKSQALLNHSLSYSSSLAQLVKDKLAANKPELTKANNSISFQFEPLDLGSAIVKGKSFQLISSILENCLQNSTRFTKNGAIHIQIRTVDDGKSFELIIKDNGPGMSKAMLARVQQGERGATTDGNGVGISGLYQQISAYQGTMSVESTEDKTKHGTQFTWKLPCQNILADDSPETKKEAPIPIVTQPVTPITRRKIKKSGALKNNVNAQVIYYIDDQPISHRLFTTSLGNVIAKAKKINGINALADTPIHIKAIKHPNELLSLPPQAIKNIVGVITDIHLGLVNGEQVNGITEAKEIRASLPPDVPIYSYSGDSHEPDGQIINGHILKGGLISKTAMPFLKAVATVIKTTQATQQATTTIDTPLDTTISQAEPTPSTSTNDSTEDKTHDSILLAISKDPDFIKNQLKKASLSLPVSHLKNNKDQQTTDTPLSSTSRVSKRSNT